MWARLRKVLPWIGALELTIWLAATAVTLSADLPGFFAVEGPRTEACYWTDALVPGVTCGADVPGGAIWETVYNLPLLAIYVPMFAPFALLEAAMTPADLHGLAVAAGLVLAAVAIVAPMAALAWAGIRGLARGVRAGVRQLRGAG
ncbi:hypothetical protein P2H44_19355 [Albimonas sp. CAU 1670]|uniref:hypothetical protein n=1 Tax=Albimonas sp. CAU 1670 TaxID=3032599 RepID=UPI0023DC9AF9|nr:hypothetical protein [Albimonas sp. CAU 1670]MDF2234722.1 hypothetical protein [Albimonas sp. CAU 1670]